MFDSTVTNLWTIVALFPWSTPPLRPIKSCQRRWRIHVFLKLGYVSFGRRKNCVEWLVRGVKMLTLSMAPSAAAIQFVRVCVFFCAIHPRPRLRLLRNAFFKTIFHQFETNAGRSSCLCKVSSWIGFSGHCDMTRDMSFLRETSEPILFHRCCCCCSQYCSTY